MDDKNNSQFDPQLGSILNLLRDIPMLNSPPTDTPRTPISFALYDSGGVRRFYIFFNGVWRYVTLT